MIFFFNFLVIYDLKITKLYFSPHLINTILINRDLLIFQIKKNYIMSFLC